MCSMWDISAAQVLIYSCSGYGVHQGKCLSAGFPHVKYLDQTALGLVYIAAYCGQEASVALKHLVACVYNVVYITRFIQKSTMII